VNYVTSLTELLAVTKATIQLLAVSDTDGRSFIVTLHCAVDAMKAMEATKET